MRKFNLEILQARQSEWLERGLDRFLSIVIVVTYHVCWVAQGKGLIQSNRLVFD